ncbi:hypothetical protein BD289DRAFT_487049 [Coniella lustricola]|uniref:DNA 3'-5' helicase n=1 Tax=Coniella lustricola TaxID=2025994 RepID=A0A2T2ZT25_9PEZI|nr:hypothetical protein BD289DRAFT_487049 [Coniella lustricola]
MTRNNLAAHLSWLLSHSQLAQPTGPVLPNTFHDAFDSSKSLTQQSSSQARVGPLPRAAPPVAPPAAPPHLDASTRGPHYTNTSDVPPIARSRPSAAVTNDSSHEDHFDYQEEEDILGARVDTGGAAMARLMAKPTKKPTLMMMQELQVDQSPPPPGTSVGKLQQAYSASLNQISQSNKDEKATGNGSRIKVSSSALLSTSRPEGVTGSNPKPTPVQACKEEEDLEEDLHDLTGFGNLDDGVTTSTRRAFDSSPLSRARERELDLPPSSFAWKRKSSELNEEDVPSLGPLFVADDSDDEFPNIADLVPADLMTPAMLRRRNAPSSSALRSSPKLEISISNRPFAIQQSAKAATHPEGSSLRDIGIGRGTSRARSPDPSRIESTQERVLPSSLSRRCTISPTKASVALPEEDNSRAPSPPPPTNRTYDQSDVIVDSDDDDGAFETPLTPIDSDPSLFTAAKNITSGSKRKRTESEIPQHGSTMSVADTPASKRPAVLQTQPSQARLRASADPENVPDSSKARLDVVTEAPIPSSGGGSDDGTFIMGLFKQQPHVLDVLSKDNKDKLTKNSADYTRSLRESWPLERKAQVKLEKQPLVQRKQAIMQAKTAHEAYLELDAKREELVAQITIAYDADEDIEEAEARLEDLNQALDKSEDVLKQALIASGVKADSFKDLPDPQKILAEQQVADSTLSFQSNLPNLASSGRKSGMIPECTSQFLEPSSVPSRTVSFEQILVSASRPPLDVSFSCAHAQPQGHSRQAYNRNVSKPTAPLTLHDISMEDLLDDDDDDIWSQPDVLQSRTRISMSTPRAAAPARGKSPTWSKRRQVATSSEYGDGDEDFAAMVAMAEEAEHLSQEAVSRRDDQPRAKPALSEASVNVVQAARTKVAAKKATKPVPKLIIPPQLMQHPWSKDVLRAFKDRFRLEGFRINQLEAINATLAGHDAFVLMPTGGGKSLCYQLPAVINSGKTHGVTIVVTPLLSLMQDQVDHLTARGIIAKSFNGDMDRHEKNDILQNFKLKNPEHFVQLLYVTPEMVNKSTAFIDGLRTLHRNKKFARLVIDEAHCVSQWGHDFRPDYKELGQIRQQFPGVPIIALTATATNNVIVDIKHNLSMEQCKVFSQSFNRPNLYYEIRPKERQPIDRISELINDKYPGKSGIVYTLSRKQTETIAGKLRDAGVSAEHYHAHMTPIEKARVQRQWQSGRIKVVVATIAFGMGIDKPDVRFVIHHYLPKSLEGYYQETGRAGRDGLPSDCHLFFSHGDIHQLKKFIDDSDGNRAQKDRQKEMLNRVVMYCENKRDCRRSQLLHYFGETFSKEQCGSTCDNCRVGGHFEVEDRTEYAQAVLQAIMYHSRLTMVQCTDILSGKKKAADADESRQSFHGMAKGLTKYEINQIITNLAMQHALGEENKVGGGGIAIQYFILGPQASGFLNGDRQLKMVVRQGGDKKAAANTTKKRVTKKKSTIEESRPTSTCISSPVRGGTRKKSTKGKSVARYLDEEAAVAFDEEDSLDLYDTSHIDGYENDGFVVADNDDDDYFDPPPLRQKSRQRTLNTMTARTTTTTATTSNPRFAATEPIDEMQELLIPDYMEEAKKLEEETRNNRSLRRPLFTEAQMRQMIINWTDTLNSMRMLPGIDTDKVTKYGPRFIPLVRKYHDIYLSFHGANDDSMATIPATAGPSSSRRVSSQPSGNIIELLTDDEDSDNNDDEDDEGGSADSNNPGVPSKYFGAKGQDDPLQAQLQGWQERFAATSQQQLLQEPMSRGSRGAGSGSSSSSRKGYGGSSGKRNYFRKGGEGTRGGSRSYSGVSKNRGSTSGGSGNRRTSGGGGGRGSGASGGNAGGRAPSKGATTARLTIPTMPY